MTHVIYDFSDTDVNEGSICLTQYLLQSRHCNVMMYIICSILSNTIFNEIFGNCSY